MVVMRLGAVWILLCLGSCRLDFDTRRDAAAVDTSTIDAPMLCFPLANGETVDQCIAALAAPAMAPDQVVYDCAISCVLGRCRVHDAANCSACSCPAYAWSTAICDDSTNLCTAPLTGTGCIGGGYYAGAPIMCPSNGTVTEGACIMRYLASIGDC